MLEVRYKCRCLQDEVRVQTAERQPMEDVVWWVEEVVGRAVYADHLARSPTCTSKTMEYMKIPAPENAAYIGAKPRLDS